MNHGWVYVIVLGVGILIVDLAFIIQAWENGWLW